MSRIFGGARQLGTIVRDADAAMHEWARVGVGPFFVVRRLEFTNYRYRGKSAPAPVVTLCFGQAGPLQVEIIQQHNDAPSAYMEFLGAGREGAQHVASWFADKAGYDAAYERLLRQGMTVVHEGATTDSIPVRFSYFETALPGGMMVELAEALLPSARGLFDMVEASAQDWDGTNPIRDLG